MKNEFEIADADAGVLEPEVTRMPAKREPASAVMKYRADLVKKYHKGADSLAEKLKKSGRIGYEEMLEALIEEIVKETDHLLGNELVASENGELRDASVISFKRSEVLEKAIKAVQTKQQGEAQSGVDIDSPAMMEVFRYFMMKMREVMVRIGASDETNDLFFRTFGEETGNWKRELRERFEVLKAKPV